MTTNKSPQVDPNTTPIATIKLGKDNNKWIVLDNSKGKNQWILLGENAKSYKTHSNGSFPFNVVVVDKTILIFKNISKSDENSWQLCSSIKSYSKVFIGKNTKKYSINSRYGSFTGNTILIEVKQPCSYMYIGNSIVEFKTKEPILQYHSVMGDSDVPYPFAISENYIYVTMGNDFAYTKRIKGDPDPWGSYYGFQKVYTTKFIKLKHKKIC